VPPEARGSRLADADLRRLFQQSRGERWGLDPARFAATLEASIDHAWPGASARDRARHAATLRLEDLALACACADGHEAAWEHFVREQRPALYRAADALDPGGGARDLADALYADLFGLAGRGGSRNSLLAYYHGRSTLATWLRAVLAQRVVDRARVRKRLAPLPEEPLLPATHPELDPDVPRLREQMRSALAAAVAALEPRDRWRLGCYYGQQMTLAETGRLLREHEATVSRQLARSRAALRTGVERRLRAAGLSDATIAESFEVAVEDAGPLDLVDLFAEAGARKNPAAGRSS
jgi:RNA polymerase sigma factor (sigma-70 family)